MSSFTGTDIWSNILKQKVEDVNRPMEQGEFPKLISELSPQNRTTFNEALSMYRKLVKELPKIRTSTNESSSEARVRAEGTAESYAKSFLVVLRDKKNVNQNLPVLLDRVRLELYNTYLMETRFDEALDLFPKFRLTIEERLNGITVLSTEIREGFFKKSLLDQYFSTYPEAKRMLIGDLSPPKPLDPDALKRLAYFGTQLPLYFMLSSCIDFKTGTCRSADKGVETRIRLLFGSSLDTVRPGVLDRACGFSTTFG